MDAKEVSLHMLSNTFVTPVELSLMSPIPTLPRMDNVSSERTLLLDTLDMEASTLLKEMKLNLQRDSTMPALLLFPSKSLLDSRTIFPEYTKLITVARPLWM